MDESCPIGVGHVSYKSCPQIHGRHATWLIDVGVMRHEDWVMSYVSESCPTSMSHVPYLWVMSHVTWLIDVRVMRHEDWVMSHVRESCPTSMSHVPYLWVMSHVTWLIDVRVMRHEERVMSHYHVSCPISMSHVPYQWVMPHINESCHMMHDSLMFESSVGENSQQIWVLPGESDRYRTRQVVIILVP